MPPVNVRLIGAPTLTAQRQAALIRHLTDTTLADTPGKDPAKTWVTSGEPDSWKLGGKALSAPLPVRVPGWTGSAPAR